MNICRSAAQTLWLCTGLCVGSVAAPVAVGPAAELRRPLAELTPRATIALGRTADWVAVTPDAVWVGSTGPNAVHAIDPRTNARRATVLLPGNPCAGLAVGFGSLWVPLCGHPNRLARVDLSTQAVTLLPGMGPAAREGGITVSADSVWLVTRSGMLARVDPATNRVRQHVVVPRGSYNPLYAGGYIWVTQAEGSGVVAVDATVGNVVARIHGGPHPRFLTAGAGAVWALNQGDGSLTRFDAATRRATQTVALGTPGHGGDVTYAAAHVWTTMAKVPLSVVDASSGALRCQWTGAGGDSLGIGDGVLWLTDYERGTIVRYELDDVLAHCPGLGHP